MSDSLSGIPLRDGDWRRDGRWWVHPDGTRVPVIAGGTNVFALTQRAYRWYADGTESGATALRPENHDTHLQCASDAVAVLRICLTESGSGSGNGAATDDYQLQYSKNGGAFANVTAASSDVRGFASANLTDAEATTQRLSAGGGSFVAGKVSEDGLVDNLQITANNHTELVYALEFVAADVAEGDLFTFRVLLNGATTNMTYSVTPTLRCTDVAQSAPVQEKYHQTMASGTSWNLSFDSNVTTGNTVALVVVKDNPNVDTTISASDATNGSYTLVERLSTVDFSREIYLFVKRNVTGGFTQVTVSSNQAATDGQAALFEVSGLDNSASIVSGDNDVTGSASFNMASAGLTATGFLFGGTIISNAFQVNTIENGYVQTNDSAQAIFVRGWAKDRAWSSTQGAVTTAASENAASAIAIIPAQTGTTIAAPAGAAALSGLVASVGLGLGLAVGSLALSGQSVGVAFSAPETGTLEITGQAPAVLNGPLVAIPQGTITATGEAPTVTAFGPLEVPAGTLTFTGQAPTLSEGVGRAPAAGAITADGQALSLVNGLQVQAGALAATGTTPALATDVGIPAGAGVVITGQAPSLAFIHPQQTGAVAFNGETLLVAVGQPVPAGALTIDGQTTTLDYTVPQSAGAVDVTGYAPTLSIDAGGENVTRAPDAGALVVTGTASVLAYDVPPAVGALTFSGQAPSLPIAVRVDMPAGVLVLTGHTPALSTALDIPAGSLSLTGQPASVSLAFVVGVPSGALSLDGQTPAVVGEGAIVPNSGTLTLSGQAPSALIAYVLTPGAGSVSVAGTTATVALGIDLSSGALAFTGTTLTLAQSYTLSPDAAALTFTGQAPAIGLGQLTVAPDAGALTFSGQVLFASQTAIPEVTILVRQDVDTIHVREDVGTIYVRPDRETAA